MSDIAELILGLGLLIGALIVWRLVVVRRRSRTARLARQQVGSALSPVQELQGVPARAPRAPVSTPDLEERPEPRRDRDEPATSAGREASDSESLQVERGRDWEQGSERKA